MRALGAVTLALCLLLAPAAVALGLTARNYAVATRDITSLRVEILGLEPTSDTPGGRRAYPGPDVRVRVFGLQQTSLTLDEINFSLDWQDRTMAVAAAFPRVLIQRGQAVTFTVETNLDPVRADEMRGLLAAGQRGFTLHGNLRLRLPHSAASVWLQLDGPIRAGKVPGGARW